MTASHLNNNYVPYDKYDLASIECGGYSQRTPPDYAPHHDGKFHPKKNPHLIKGLCNQSTLLLSATVMEEAMFQAFEITKTESFAWHWDATDMQI